MRRKHFAFVAALGALVLLAGIAASVTHGKSEKGKQTAAPSGTVTLAGWSVSTVESALLKQVVKGFERKYPRIKVDYSALGDYDRAMLAKFSARQPPDVFYVDSNRAPTWIKQGVLEPLDSYVQKSKFQVSPFYSKLMDAFRVKGKIYGFPKDWSPLGMQINTAMLAKAGIKAPTTWAQLRTAAQRLKSRNAVPNGKPICLAADWARILAFVYQNKGSFLNASKTKATVDTPAVKGAIDFYLSLMKADLLDIPAKLGSDWCGEALGKEKAAIIFEGNWLVPYMVEKFPDVGYKTFPMVKGKQQGNVAYTVAYGIGRNSKNKEAAFTLLSYLVGKVGMKTWTSKGLALPSRKDVKPVAGRAAFLKAAPYARPWQFAAGFDKVMTVAGNEFSAVVEGKQTVSAMLKKIQDEANATLRRGG